MIGGETGLLALLGKPVGRSLSPAMRNASFAADGPHFRRAPDPGAENLLGG